MKNNFLKYLITGLFTLSLPVLSFAQTAEEIAESNAAAGLGPAPVAPTPEPEPAKVNTDTGSGGGKVPSSNGGYSINKAADDAKDSQKQGAQMNMIAGAMMMAACMASQPPNMALCAMGALALMQAAHDKKAADKSDKTYEASLADGSGSGENKESKSEPESPRPSEDSLTGYGFNNPDIKAGLDALKNNGYGVSEGGIKMPDGSFVPSDAMGSAASMTAAGFDANSAQAASAVLADINKKLGDPNAPNIVSMGVDSSGGGGSSSRSGSDDSSGYSFKNPWNLSANARSKMVAGKSVTLAGEPIGVKGDNLFEMVHRAYDKKRKTENFIESESASGGSRMPASVSSRPR